MKWCDTLAGDRGDCTCRSERHTRMNRIALREKRGGELGYHRNHTIRVSREGTGYLSGISSDVQHARERVILTVRVAQNGCCPDQGVNLTFGFIRLATIPVVLVIFDIHRVGCGFMYYGSSYTKYNRFRYSSDYNSRHTRLHDLPRIHGIRSCVYRD